MRLVSSCFLLGSVLLTGCGADQLSPVARIELSTNTLCQESNDAIVTISGAGSTSADGGEEGLRFTWRIDPAPLEITAGSLSDEQLAARFDATEPIAISLLVRDRQGLEGSRQRTLGLTITEPTPCTRGCEAHQVCAPVEGAEFCVDDPPPEDRCLSDSDCPCLRCGADDNGVRRCLPP